MDIKSTFKQVMAGAATLALLATNATVALANTFPDTAGTWYNDAVEEGVELGIWDSTQPLFRGADNMLRAEAATVMIRMVNGLDGFTAPSDATFLDVPAVGSEGAQWYSNYMEAAAALNIMTGDTTPQGTPTGFARPSGHLNRAEAAALVVRTFELSTENNAAFPHPFPDVPAGVWYENPIQTAYANGVLQGNPDGTVAPERNVNRAEMAVMLIRAMNPTSPGVDPVDAVTCENGEYFDVDAKTCMPVLECESDEYFSKTTGTCEVILECENGEYFDEETGMCEDMTASDGTLQVSLNANSPGLNTSTTLPLGAQNVELLDVDFMATGDNVTVNQVLVTRLGVGEVMDWDGVYLYEGENRLSSERTFSSETNQAIFNLKNVMVAAGETKTLTLVGNVSIGAKQGNEHFFSVVAATDVTSNAQETTGTFPASGGKFTFSGVTVSTANLDAVTISKPTIGQKDAEIGAFRITASGANDIALNRISITQNGTFSASDFGNLRLLAGSDEVATAESFVGDRVTFVLDTPFQINAGQNRTFYVHGDINGGRTTEFIELYVEEKTDVKVMDLQYGFGAQVINNTFTIAGVQEVYLEGGDIVLVDNSAPSTQIAVNSTGQYLTEFGITADRDVLVRNTDVKLEIRDADGDGPNVSGTLGTANTVAGTGAFASLPNQAITYTADAPGVAGNSITVTLIEELADLGGDSSAVDVVTVGNNIIVTYHNDTNVPNPETVGQMAIVNCINAPFNASVDGTGVVVGNTFVDCITDGSAAALVTATGGTVATNIVTLAPTNLTGGVEGTVSSTATFCVDSVNNFTKGDAIRLTATSGTVHTRLQTVAPNDPACGGAAHLFETPLAAGNLVAGGVTVTEVNPYQFLKNIKLVDVDSENTLAGPLTNASLGVKSADTPNTYTYTFPEDYDLFGAKTRNIAVVADIDQNMPEGYRVRATVSYEDGYIRDQDANESFQASDVIGSPLAGKFMTIQDNTLLVARSSSPISQSYVLGQTGVNVLGVNLQSGDAGEVKVRKMVVRAYGDDGGTNFDDANGDGSANLLVSSVSLYNGNTLVAGPKSLSASANGEYHIANFDQLNVVIPKGGNLNLTVRANLLNTKTGMIAFDVVPSQDITAEDVNSNTLTLSSTPINTFTTPNFAVQHAVMGTGGLNVSQSSSPTAGIAIAGAQEVFTSQYSFQATQEDFKINRFTVINDLTGAFDVPVATAAVTSVTAKYPNAQGVMQTKTVNMVNGSATFSGLDFVVRQNISNSLEIYANVAGMQNQPVISGKTFRLGVRDTNNTQATFDAVGIASSNTITSGFPITGAASIAEFTVRKSVPTFTQTTITGGLGNGVRDLYDVTVKADGGSVHLARMVFDITPSLVGASPDIANFNFYAGNSKLQPSQVNIQCEDGGNLAEGSGNTLTDCGTDINETHKVIVTFNQPQNINLGASRNYRLEATMSGIQAGSNSQLSTRLATGDEFAPLTGLDDKTNPNTGKIYVDANPAAGIFTGSAAAFSQLLVNSKSNFIWSDGSALIHLYPVVTNGVVVNDDGSEDFTNGYLLQINNLKVKTLTSN